MRVRVTPARVALALALLLLFVLDLARATYGLALRPWQWAAGAAVVLALWRVLGQGEPGAGREGRAGRWAVVALAALLVPTFVDHGRRIERGDAVHYYAYLRSLLFDGDLELTNEYHLMGWPEVAHLPNVLPVGAPLAWSPWVVPVHLVRQAGRVFGMDAPSGVEPIYPATIAFATLVYGAAGLFLLMATLRRWVPPAAAFWTTVVVWVGSPVRFYLSVLPGVAHGVEFAAAAAVLWTSLRLRDAPDRARAAAAGAACGAAFLMRSQDGLLLGLPLALLAFAWLGGMSRRAVLVPAGVLLAAFALAALPQVLVWQNMFGTPVLVPHQALHGDQFLRAEPQLGGALFSARGGLFTSHPALLAAVAGLVAFARRDVRYVAATLPILIAMWWLNASVFDWYHVRRYTGIVPLLAPGLALVLLPVARAGILPAAALAAALWRYDVAVDTLRSAPGDPAPVRAVLAETSDAAAASAYGALVPFAPAAAARGLAAYTGEPVLDDRVTRITLGADTSLLRLPVRARNLSASVVADGVACRWIRGDDARLFLPSPTSGPLRVTVRALPHESQVGGRLELLWDERPVGLAVLAPGWSEYRFAVPHAHAGTNVLALRVIDPSGRGRVVRRSAALASIDLHRVMP